MGVIRGVARNGGSGTATVAVTDNGTPPLSASQSFTITITDLNNAPTLDPVGNQSVSQGSVLNVAAAGHDIDPAAPNNTLRYSLVSGPGWLSIDSVLGIISGVAANAGSGSVTVRVSDGGDPVGFAEATFFVTVIDRNDAPVLMPIASLSVAQGQGVLVQAAGSDADPAGANSALSY